MRLEWLQKMLGSIFDAIEKGQRDLAQEQAKIADSKLEPNFGAATKPEFCTAMRREAARENCTTTRIGAKWHSYSELQKFWNQNHGPFDQCVEAVKPPADIADEMKLMAIADALRADTMYGHKLRQAVTLWQREKFGRVVPVYEAVKAERDFQDQKTYKPKTLAEFILILEGYVSDLRQHWNNQTLDESALHDVRKIAATAIHAMEQCGIYPRKGI